jgi:hypothetical protein
VRQKKREIIEGLMGRDRGRERGRDSMSGFLMKGREGEWGFSMDIGCGLLCLRSI